jgi:hypothetical protein
MSCFRFSQPYSNPTTYSATKEEAKDENKKKLIAAHNILPVLIRFVAKQFRKIIKPIFKMFQANPDSINVSLDFF